MKTQVNGVPEWDAAAAIDGASVRVPLTKALAGIESQPLAHHAPGRGVLVIEGRMIDAVRVTLAREFLHRATNS